MLVRTFRLTDKLSNAFLRLTIWAGESLLLQIFRLRVALVAALASLWFTLTQTARTGRVAYQTTEERRRAMMARRAAEAAERPAVREDPLKTQNRALSMFTVVLLGSLIMLVLWFTGVQQTGGAPPPRGVLPPILPSTTKAVFAAPFPTIKPTATPIPDPLRVGGSIVYTQHERGFDNLWAVEIGQTAPIRLTNDAADDRDPAWSHDGTRVAFASHRDGNWELYVMTVATGNISRLTYTPGYERSPSWSPDDKYITYEAYDSTNLDIWIVAADGKQEPQRLTENPAPDFAPAWSPGGRDIAFVSLRGGSPEIYVLNLDKLGNPKDSTAQRLTNAPDIEENAPVWSPDGQLIAYSGRDSKGLELIYTKPVAQPEAEPTVIGQGRDPAWSPNGASVLAAVDRGQATTLIAHPVGNGVAATTISLKSLANHPNWTAAALPDSLKQQPPPSDPVAPELYNEEVRYEQPNPPYHRLATVFREVQNALLVDKVDDSFLALREAVRGKTGLDFLGARLDMWWAIQGADRHIPDPGQPLQNWHYAGRAFDFDRNLVYSSAPDAPPPIEVVREDDQNGNTYWRVYVRVSNALQGGALGEPLKRLPWDFASRTSTDPQAYENGGRPKSTAPSGYYVDLTALAQDYGWDRIPANRAWRSLASGLLYWEFDKRENMAWNDAMLELYTQEDIAAFLSGPTPVSLPSQPPTVPGPTRTPTPIPPDKTSP